MLLLWFSKQIGNQLYLKVSMKFVIYFFGRASLPTSHLYTLLVVVALALFYPKRSVAQVNVRDFDFESRTAYLVVLFDESEYIGSFLGRENNMLILATLDYPRIGIPFNQIRSITKVEPENFVNGEYWYTTPSSSRYLQLPSAMNLKSGEAFYLNAYLAFNTINVGITDNLSMAGGIDFYSLVNGDPLFFVNPRYGKQINPDMHIGGGVIYANVVDQEYGIAYGLFTYGNKNTNITAGLGFGYYDTEFSFLPTSSLSGTMRLKKNFALVGESWYIPDNAGLFAYAIRFFGESFTFDLGMINNRTLSQELLFGVPYIDVGYKF